MDGPPDPPPRPVRAPRRAGSGGGPVGCGDLVAGIAMGVAVLVVAGILTTAVVAAAAAVTGLSMGKFSWLVPAVSITAVGVAAYRAFRANDRGVAIGALLVAAPVSALFVLGLIEQYL